MYESYWELKEKPFENTPDPRFLYHSQRHEEALSRMLYAVREKKGGAILTGEYGSGKTLLSRVLLEELNNEQYQSVLIFNPRLAATELIREIIYQLGNDTNYLTPKADLLHSLNQILYDNMKDNKKTVIVVDEAQAMPDENSFEELRLLLNFQLNDNFLLTLIIIGQPELKDKIKDLPQLKQRLAIRYHLVPLSEKETKEYIQHRLKVAGSKKEIFLLDAYNEIYKYSEGTPRKINNICDMALLVSCGEKMQKIDRALVKEIAEDLEETLPNKEEAEVSTDG